MANKGPRFRVKKDNGGDYYWMFYAANGEEIARSSESYNTKRDCLHSIALIKSEGPAAPVFDWTVATDSQGNYPSIPAAQVV